MLIILLIIWLFIVLLNLIDYNIDDLIVYRIDKSY